MHVFVFVIVFPAANFVLFLPDGRVVHLELVHIFSRSSAVLLPCYCSVCSFFAGEKQTAAFLRKPFLIYYFYSTEFESRCARIHLL